jgi:hypothetical protein
MSNESNAKPQPDPSTPHEAPPPREELAFSEIHKGMVMMPVETAEPLNIVNEMEGLPPAEPPVSAEPADGSPIAPSTSDE